MNSFKILHTLELEVHPGLTDIYLKTLLPKFDLSQTKQICFDTEFYLKREILEMITPTSLERFILNYTAGVEINPALFAFRKCRKLKVLRNDNAKNRF
uniref:Uncharacterized protein n=1 Tax=Panagrolaimus sp. PS1159 TaxID=55785 RepID=A0AC35GRP9_9BILA